MSRFALFGQEIEGGLAGLGDATEPTTDEPVRAVIDLALIGEAGDGKTELAATLIRTLRAHAPDLGPGEAANNQSALRAVMGAESPAAGDGERVAHYTFRVAIDSVIEMLPPLARLGILARTGVARLPLAPSVMLLGAATALAWTLPAPLHTLPPIAALILSAMLVARSFRVAGDIVADAGEIELVIWDPPGKLFDGERTAELYDLLAHLSRRRRAVQPGWRTYAFVPVLLINPARFGRAGRRNRLRGLLPMFAALGGRDPRAVVAINRWALVAGACPPGSRKDETAAVRIETHGAEPERLTLDRDALTRACVEVEDGRDGGLALTHIRYEACADPEVASEGDETVYRASGGGGTLSGEARRHLAALLAELALAGAEPPPPPHAEPAGHWVEDDRPQHHEPYQPTGDEARRTLEAMSASVSPNGEWVASGSWRGPADCDPGARS
jgi:hypothetical protein